MQVWKIRAALSEWDSERHGRHHSETTTGHYPVPAHSGECRGRAGVQNVDDRAKCKLCQQPPDSRGRAMKTTVVADARFHVDGEARLLCVELPRMDIECPGHA